MCPWSTTSEAGPGSPRWRGGSWRASGSRRARTEGEARGARSSARIHTVEQERGLKLFDTSAKCGQCHELKGDRPLFTDFEYHNLGVPKNPSNPTIAFDDPGTFDPGLSNHTGIAAHEGKFRTPTVRNVAKGSHRTYMHNGVLQSLTHAVDFYNTRDALPTCTPAQLAALDPSEYGSEAFGGAGCWPPPEFGENQDTRRMGDLGLTPDEVEAIVAFMEALTDH